MHNELGADARAALSEAESAFAECGHTDLDYLRHHWARFFETKREFCSGWPRERGLRLLDVGAHWLHQSWLWAIDGFEVTAVDLPVTFEYPSVRSMAERHGMRLVPCSDLESAQALQAISDDSIDVMLFTEIIEHITFNPIAFWTQVHRILAPGARIIVTTPNYYALQGRAWAPGRFLKGFGGGITVDEILGMRTYGHHWKEFTLHEVIRYFCLLSPDFNCIKACYPDRFGLSSKASAARVQRWFPKLRPNLHLEIELPTKQAGITASPTW